MKLALLFGRMFGLALMIAAEDAESDDLIVWFSTTLCFRRRAYSAALTSVGFVTCSGPWNGLL